MNYQVMKYRITILHNDGTQENYKTDHPGYQHLDNRLSEGDIRSFVVTLNRIGQL